MAPVNAPFSCPNNSLSIKLGLIAAQLTSMKGFPCPVAGLVYAARDEFFAGTRLAGDEDAQIEASRRSRYFS